MALTPQVYASSTNDAFFVLMTITNPDTGEVLRVVNNIEDVVSGGKTFMAYPFQIVLPNDTDDTARTASITIDNIDRVITEYVRASLNPPTVKLEVVISSAPDVVERVVDFLQLSSVEYDAYTVTATLEPYDFLSLPAIDSIYSGYEFIDLVYN